VAWLGSRTAPLTVAALVAVLIPVLMATVWTLANPPSSAAMETDPGTSAFAWSSILLVAVGWELAAWLRQPAYNVSVPDDPTLSVLLDSVTETRPGRFIAWTVWLWIGWRFIRP
jgi:hypothetical protein